MTDLFLTSFLNFYRILICVLVDKKYSPKAAVTFSLAAKTNNKEVNSFV